MYVSPIFEIFFCYGLVPQEAYFSACNRLCDCPRLAPVEDIRPDYAWQWLERSEYCKCRETSSLALSGLAQQRSWYALLRYLSFYRRAHSLVLRFLKAREKRDSCITMEPGFTFSMPPRHEAPKSLLTSPKVSTQTSQLLCTLWRKAFF